MLYVKPKTPQAADFLGGPWYKGRMAKPLADFQHDGIHLRGFSLAGEETYVVAPELNLTFDIGRAPRETLTVDNIFLSHGHMDHAAGLAYYFSQRMFIDAPVGTVYAPEPLVPPIEDLLRIWGEIDGHRPKANVRPARPDEDIELRRDLLVRPFHVHHPGRGRGRAPVHALGFAAIETRRKLLEEYSSLTGPQIVELKKQGVEITRRVEIPLVAYSGDTGPGSFLDLDHVRNAKVLVLECTFVTDEHRTRARSGNHMHINDLRDVLPKLNNERIVLTHLTRRTPLADARAVLRKTIGPDADERVSFLMEHARRGRRPRPTSGEKVKG